MAPTAYVLYDQAVLEVKLEGKRRSLANFHSAMRRRLLATRRAKFPRTPGRLFLGKPMATFSLLIAGLSLGVSIATAWFTQLRRGKLAMTRPSLVHIGFDDSATSDRPAKVYLRMLLYSTAVRGQAVERLYMRLGDEAGRKQIFGFWAYADGGGLTPGSGLYVPSQGTVMNHHFVLGADRTTYPFTAGRHSIEVFANVVRAKPTKLVEVEVTLTADHAAALNAGVGVLFSSDPETGRYYGQVEPRYAATTHKALPE